MNEEAFFLETNEKFICEDCKKPFKSYHYYERCTNCNDGFDYETGEECRHCGGNGEWTSIAKDTCQDCLYLYLTKED